MSVRSGSIPLATATQYATPTTGQTVTLLPFSPAKLVGFVDPAGTLVALTVALPVASDGQIVAISSSQAITTLTLTTGVGSILNAITTLALGGFAMYAWSATAAKWFRLS